MLIVKSNQTIEYHAKKPTYRMKVSIGKLELNRPKISQALIVSQPVPGAN
jgi:hypothetical protein